MRDFGLRQTTQNETSVSIYIDSVKHEKNTDYFENHLVLKFLKYN